MYSLISSHGKKPSNKVNRDYQKECLWSIFRSSILLPILKGPSVVYKCEPYFVVGCGSCPCNLLTANMNNTQLRYRVRIIWNGENINTVLKNLVQTRPLEKVYCILKETLHTLQSGQSILIASRSQIKIYKQKESYLLLKVHQPIARQSADIDSMIRMHENS